MRRKALIVEDDTQTRRLLGKLVEAQDCKVDEAADGLKALELLSKNDYDVVLLDIVLPKVSGTQIMDHLCATNPALLERVIVVTGLNVEDIRQLFPTVCHALSKPVIPNRLMDTIHKCLDAVGSGL
ncbi:MAG TPA: response regulator [Thermoanaerobaculia bacterium]|nr:response regulator [Thermoanaerobaculia bacterium]